MERLIYERTPTAARSTWLAVCLLLGSASATAQIPRTADGKPNLAAPAPRTSDGKPDLTGVWLRMSAYGRDVAMDLKPGEVQPWAKALVERRMEDLGIDHMSHLCLPWGPN